jgi:hypothetical protein
MTLVARKKPWPEADPSALLRGGVSSEHSMHELWRQKVPRSRSAFPFTNLTVISVGQSKNFDRVTLEDGVKAVETDSKSSGRPDVTTMTFFALKLSTLACLPAVNAFGHFIWDNASVH